MALLGFGGKKRIMHIGTFIFKKRVKCQYYNFWACSQFIKKQASQVWGSIQGKYFRLKEGGMGEGAMLNVLNKTVTWDHFVFDQYCCLRKVGDTYPRTVRESRVAGWESESSFSFPTSIPRRRRKMKLQASLFQTMIRLLIELP